MKTILSVVLVLGLCGPFEFLRAGLVRAADEKAVELAAKKNGTFFLQIVKEPMPEPAAEDAPGPQAK